jgi:hypothetical protein
MHLSDVLKWRPSLSRWPPPLRGAAMEFEFEMKFKLGAANADPDGLVERLGAAGCDDALVGIGLPGRIALSFTRDSCSAAEAVVTALRDVKAGIPDVELIEVTPKFAGLTDLSELLGVSRPRAR